MSTNDILSWTPEQITQVVSQPDWYLQLENLIKTKILPSGNELSEDGKQERLELLQLFVDLYKEGKICVGKPRMNFDEERKPTDTVVIHHTSWFSGIDIDAISAVQLLRLYVPQFLSPERPYHHQTIYSGHFDESGCQVFYGYHWLIREDGTPERLLKDEYIGWHAGWWSVNKRSVGICLDGDFEKQEPPPAMLTGLKKLIATHYPQVSKRRRVGHCEVNSKITCPGLALNFVRQELRQGRPLANLELKTA